MREHRMQTRVYYADTDALGIVYHANYLRFFEAARTECLRAAGINLNTLLTEHGVQFAVVQAQVKYLKAARLDDELLIVSRVSHIGKASVQYIQEIFHAISKELLCSAEIKLAVINKHMQVTAVPDALKKGILHDY